MSRSALARPGTPKPFASCTPPPRSATRSWSTTWRHIDPTVKDRQFCDSGSQYRSGIYWQNEAERKVAEASRDELLKSKRFPAIHTELAAANTFWIAEEYHQDYYKKNPLRYNYYRASCGRDARVEELWGKR